MFDRLVIRATLGLLCLVFLMILIWLLGAPAQAQPQVDLSGKNVLVLHAWEANLPMSTETNKGLSRVFNLGGIPAFNQSFECLDLRRNPGPEYRKLLVEKMRLQYGRRKPDLIIAVNPIAMKFATYDCRDIFADIPILALMLPQGFQVPKSSRRVISHFPSLDIVGTLDIALKLVPHAKRVYVASGSYETDIAFENQVRRLSKKWEGRLQFLYLSSMPFEDMLVTVSKVPPDSIILTLGFARDVSGKLLTTPTAIRRLSQASAVPVFGIADVALGYGIAGGFLSSYEFIGTKAGELVLDILRGGPTEEHVPNVLDVPCVPMFDWRELRRWKLSEVALPKGSIIINKEVTLWDLRYYIIAAIAFILMETALIIFLIVQKRRKKLAEQSLREKTEELDRFFNVSLDMLCIANTDGYFVRLNPAIERILGYTREELIATRFFDFVHPDDLDRTREAVSTLASHQELFLFENRYRCKDGAYRWLQWSSVPAGNLIYAAARDVTDRKQAEQKLKKSEERFRMLIETMNEGLGVRNEKGVWTYVNNQLCWMLGHLPGDIIGHPVTEFLDEANQSVFGEEIEKQRKGGYFPYEITWIRKDGRKVTTIVSPKPIFNSEGQLKEIFAVITDITERKRAEKEALDARRELLRMDRLSRMGELSASLSHELNQPLTAILSNARAALRFLQSGKLDPGELEEILQDIVTDDKRAGDIIRGLRTLVTKDAGERETISINDVLHETVSLFRSEAIIRNIRIEMDLADPLPLVDASKVQIQQVLINLMMNAAESMARDDSANKAIAIQTVMSHDGMVQVAVRDFGSGIEEPDLPRIFEAFFTTKRSGLGMGLSLSRSIVESHGGHIWARNNPDKGITFYFDLPAIKSSDQ